MRAVITAYQSLVLWGRLAAAGLSVGAGLTGGAATVNVPRAAALGRTRLQASPRLHGAGPGPPMGRAGRGSRARPARWGAGVMASGGDGGSGRGAADGTEPSRGGGVEGAGTGGGSSESGSCATSLSASSE